MKNLAELADKGLMYLANKGVHAWNWTTGRTKADLANLLLASGAIAVSAGEIANTATRQEHIWTPFLIAPFNLLLAHVVIKGNKKIESLEERAIEKEAKDIRVESFKERVKLCGYIWSSLAPVHTYNYLSSSNKEVPCYPLSDVLYATSFFVMCADNLPPRKNVLSRAKDKLVELIKNYRSKPALSPSPTQ